MAGDGGREDETVRDAFRAVMDGLTQNLLVDTEGRVREVVGRAADYSEPWVAIWLGQMGVSTEGSQMTVSRHMQLVRGPTFASLMEQMRVLSANDPNGPRNTASYLMLREDGVDRVVVLS